MVRLRDTFMILPVQRVIREEIVRIAERQFGVRDVPPFAVEVPPDRALGDLAVTIAFQLARLLRKPPRLIAQTLAPDVRNLPGVASAVPAANGYLNLYLDRPAFLLARLRHEVREPESAFDKTIVEHTAINPNKAAHIGHLRNAVLGDTLARVLRCRGVPVEVQNYIDDLGVQVADIIVGLRSLENLSVEQIRELAATPRFDYYCWDLYARVTQWYDGNSDRLAVRAAALHDLEAGGNEAAAAASLVVDRIVRAHLRTMSRIGIRYDLLTYESDIVRLQFWARAFEILKTSGAVYLQQSGRLAGCWVMRIDDGDMSQDVDDPEAREKVIVRSNGVVTYVGKDIANQLWKFGLLGRDFNYRRFDSGLQNGLLWSTTSAAGQPGAPPFGRAKRTYNVIDSRQVYLQALLTKALNTLGYPEAAENSIHFSYEMVALSHATAGELGYASSGSEAKPFVEVSGRKGLGVKIDDLLDVLTTKATGEVAARNPDFSPEECQRGGAQIAAGAIRYFMLKYSRGKLIVFDIEEALSFEGESGPYLQYAVVRANSIFLKLKEREGLTEGAIVGMLDPSTADELTDADSALWKLVFESSRLDDVVEQVIRSLEFSMLAKYAFTLAQLFNAFYHRFPILNETQGNRKCWRAAGVAYVRDQLARTLDLMGIEVPTRM